MGLLFLKGISIYGHFMPKSMGILFIVAGVFYGIYAITNRKRIIEHKKKQKEHDEQVLICENCKKPRYKHSVNDLICPECHGDLENLGGFYHRHPELKELYGL